MDDNGATTIPPVAASIVNNTGSKDDRKLQLLEKRLNGSSSIGLGSVASYTHTINGPSPNKTIASPNNNNNNNNNNIKNNSSILIDENKLNNQQLIQRDNSITIIESNSSNSHNKFTDKNSSNYRTSHSPITHVNINSNNNNNNNNDNDNDKISNSSNNSIIDTLGDDTSTSVKRVAEEDTSNTGKNSKVQKVEGDDSIPGTAIGHDTGSRGAGGIMKVRTIQSYFQPQASSSSSDSSAINLFNQTVTLNNSSHSSDNHLHASNSSPPAGKKEKTSYSSSGSIVTIKKLTDASSSSSSSTIATSTTLEMKKQLEQVKAAKDQLENKCLRLEDNLKSYQDRNKAVEVRNTKLCKQLEETRRLMAVQDARKKRDQLALDCVRLGKITMMRTTTNVQEIWEEGYALKELNRRSCELLERKEELERRKKKLANARRAAKRGSGGGTDDDDGAQGASGHMFELYDLDLTAEGDAIRCHLEQLKKDEMGLSEEKRMHEGEKAAHQKEIKRCQNEDRSRFYRDLPCLNGRYLFVSLLGRGGFSEVWKAFDLLELRDVAVKVHQLNSQWTDERKQSYIRHVTREYTIHRDMRHPRVVQFFDVFEIDNNSFATVLEYCKGIDLDEKLKRCRTIPEKDARTILLQMVSGLKYLNTPGEGTDEDGNVNGTRRVAVIHYDLKPANILFDEMGDLKITDFGLSKVIDDSDDGTSLELTSQGAGTYWYLPPECFAKGDEPARISSKVDVWSVGVIFYQMLYGKRPFGEGKSQERVLSEGIMLHATQVEFPSDAKAQKVSDEAKDLIRACLTHDQRLRPDVFALCSNQYLKVSHK